MPSLTSVQKHSLGSLRLRWGLLLLVSGLLLMAGYFFLQRVWGAENAIWWASVSGLSAVYQLGRLWRDLELNHRPGEKEVLPRFGWGTSISFVRLLAISLMAGFLGQASPPEKIAWIPFFLYLLANASDFVDGYFARITDWVTRLGQKLDMDLDGRALLVVTLLAFQYGRVPWWFLLVGFVRYLFLFGLWWRERQGRPNYELQPSVGRRAFAGVQMGFSTAMLAPLFHAPETFLAASLFMLPFLGNFLVDWWQVSGRSVLLGRWDAMLKPLRRFGASWGGLLVRLALALFLLLRLVQGQLSPAHSIVEGLAIAALAVGVLGRVSAIVILVETGLRQQFGDLGILDWLILTGGTVLLFWGSGSYSLWQPEQNWYQRRPGEKEKE
jgi:CDP-diacylglycerol--glycerol-3-phosphate 3-phosphatidyltransferase